MPSGPPLTFESHRGVAQYHVSESRRAAVTELTTPIHISWASSTSGLDRSWLRAFLSPNVDIQSNVCHTSTEGGRDTDVWHFMIKTGWCYRDTKNSVWSVAQKTERKKERKEKSATNLMQRWAGIPSIITNPFSCLPARGKTKLLYLTLIKPKTIPKCQKFED